MRTAMNYVTDSGFEPAQQTALLARSGEEEGTTYCEQ